MTASCWNSIPESTALLPSPAGSSSDGFTDAGVEHLVHLSQLEYLSLEACVASMVSDISDDGLKGIGRLTNLKGLTIHGRKFTDKGIEHLSGLKSLEGLDLVSFSEPNNIGDEGLSYLAGLHELRWVDIHASEVTDEGLRHLYGLKKMTYINLGPTKAADAGVAKLQAILPSVDFVAPQSDE
jgi:hypothetical protein